MLQLHSRSGWCAFFIVSAAAFYGPLRGFADEEEERPYRAGLVFTSTFRNRQTLQRVSPTAILGTPQGELGDSQYPVGVEWSGELRITAEGSYQFAVVSSVPVTIQLADKSLGPSDTPRTWCAFDATELKLDNYPLSISCTAAGPHDHVQVFWKGPQFAWEPLNPRYLVHRKEARPSDRFARGELLAHALRCGHCHQTPGEAHTYAAPSLAHARGQLRRQWLVEWLKADGKQQSVEEAAEFRRMPLFGLKDTDAEALADYVVASFASSRKVELSETPKSLFPKVEEGRRLALTLGCLACHKIGDYGQVGLFGGSDLSQVAAKRPPEFFARWLADPTAFNPQHRMPVFDLKSEEREHLAAYLATLGATKAAEPPPKPAGELSAGAKLFSKLHCAACHQTAEASASQPAVRELTDQSNWSNSCAGAPVPMRGQPGFHLKDGDRQALQTYFSTVAARDKKLGRPRFASFSSLEHQLRELNCRACHSRDDWAERSAGEPEPLAAILRPIAEEEEELAPLIPAMSPPSLNSVGDKLRDEVLRDAILRKGAEHRNYLKVMMPKFPLTRERAELLANHFIDHDRVPSAKAKETPKADELILAAGGKLASTEGFGCVSCHQIGKWQPDKAPLNARGPELLMPGKRIRREWFERWVKNPARIVPRMEMPSLQLPVRGVLGNKLDDQIDALWTALNTPGFSPPLPNAVRIVRKTGVKSDNERATVLTDVLEADGKVYIKPFVIALPNRHNLLFDCETGKLVRWWTGDAASQKTRGKSWYWEVVGDDLLKCEPLPEFSLFLSESKTPAALGQFVAELDAWQPSPNGGVDFEYRLSFPGAKGSPPIPVRIRERVEPIWESSKDTAGFRRQIEVRDLPDGSRFHWRLVSADRAEREETHGKATTTGLRNAVRELCWDYSRSDRLECKQGELISNAKENATAVKLGVRYKLRESEYPAPSLPQLPNSILAQSNPLTIAPGWTGTRLPFPEEIMPTALAWRPNGQLLFASLKGNVWQTKDADRDGVPDEATPFSDELATPYGLATGPGYIDVATKSAVLRLHGEETCEQVESIASGWGHTADYHDWVIGLPRDKQGNYYLGIPCQQDKRSPEAAKLRGTVVKLVPQTATPENPRKFQIEVLTRGHRFPMGLALSRKDALFVTDNQGNYNPFNELNHVRPGAHFGFVNALEKKEDRPPVTPPAIDIPHPWTRSVNGICFLDTPAALAKDRGPLFGPFEGQLVGCEYDTRRLIRLSLQEVDGVYQGAAYPLSLPAENPADGLLGPVVCAVSPQGELYIGNLRDSGWGGGNNIGDIVRVQFEPVKLPAGIAEVRAEKEGLRVTFMKPVSRDKAADPANYRLASYRRESTPAYGGPDQDRRDETLAGVTVADDGLSALLKLREFREGFVYEIFVKNLTTGDAPFFPAEAYFTLRKRPT